ncbi:MAG: hypothetical protein KF782_25775 [Labilithrix sp.]|nr:hypothetical protein [Labilithrix sp.]
MASASGVQVMLRCGSGSTKISKLRILVLARRSSRAVRWRISATTDPTNARKTAVSFVVFGADCRRVDMVGGAWYGRALALAGALAALAPSLAMWGFTVDDALISLRYAHHLASGAGYRFDALGPSTDGVTPLPWAPLLAPLAGGDLVVALERVKALGIVAWTAAGAVLGSALAEAAAGERRATLHALVALAVVGLAFPLGAWAASGMETGLATALATCAAAWFERPRRAALLAGLAASLRPELVVWAVIVAGGAAAAGSLARGHAARTVALALAPFALCAVVRLVAFGRRAAGAPREAERRAARRRLRRRGHGGRADADPRVRAARARARARLVAREDACPRGARARRRDRRRRGRLDAVRAPHGPRRAVARSSSSTSVAWRGRGRRSRRCSSPSPW